jgi:hypothetical protein
MPSSQTAATTGSQGVPPDAKILGLAGDRLVLTPDRGAWADVVLVDPRTFEEKEHYLFGTAAMLHVLEDGTFETTGDAAALESLVVCTDGRSVGPLAACARSAR